MRAVTRALAVLLTVSSAAFAQPTGSTPAEPAPAAPPPQPAPPAAPSPQPAPPAQDQVPAPAPIDAALAAHLSAQRDALGRRCDVRGLLAHADLRYVACGAAGVWIVRVREGVAPLTIERRDLDGTVLGLFVHGGQLWAQIASVHARPLLALEPSAEAAPQPLFVPEPAPQAAPPAAAPPLGAADDERPPQHEARVIEAGPGWVMIDAGVRSGVENGDHVALYAPATSSGMEEGITEQHDERIAVGRVDGVSAGRARVALGLNEVVEPDAPAQLTSQPLTASSLAPPHVADVWEVGFLARPFLVLDNLGAGVFADVRAGYRAAGLHFEALLSPLAFASAEQGATTPASAVLALSYDAHLFEVGLGAGGQTVNDAEFVFEPGTGITLLQRLRLGARDGLNVEALSYVALFHSEFEFSSLRITGQIPMSRGTWLLITGSGGSIGLGHGELGLRMLLSGNGGPDSFFLTTTIGGVHVFETGTCFSPFDPCGDTIDYAGPMVGVGGEWRL